MNHNPGYLADQVDKGIYNYEFHPSILLIKNKLGNQAFFRFNPYQNLTCREKLKILILKLLRQLLRILSHPNHLKKDIKLQRKLYTISSINV